MSAKTTSGPFIGVMPYDPDRKALSDADMRVYRTEMQCEHSELCHRIKGLEAAVVQADRGELWLGKKPACPVKVLKRQARAMRAYRDELELRAAYEGVELTRF